MIVPTGVVTDDSGRLLYRSLSEGGRIRSLWDFENREQLFVGVDGRARFCLLVLGAPGSKPTDYCFGLHRVSDVADSGRHFSLTAEELELLNPNTMTCPSFGSRRDADLVLWAHRRFAVTVMEGARDSADSWGIVTKPGLLNMATDSSLFEDEESESAYPVYEGKMFTFYDHRFADVVLSATAVLRQGQSQELTESEHEDPKRLAKPRYWVSKSEIRSRVKDQWDREWIPGWKEITSPTNARTLIPALLPLSGVGHKIPVFLPDSAHRHLSFALVANLSSFVVDYICRNKLNGTSLTPFTFKQLPVLSPSAYEAPAAWDPGISLGEWLFPRVLELVYTSWDMKPFGEGSGHPGPPFQWRPERRAALRSELDAAFFMLYFPSDADGRWVAADASDAGAHVRRLAEQFLTPRHAVDHVLDTFPTVRRKDEQATGRYATKEAILAEYDAMSAAVRSGSPYSSRLLPPPADPTIRHSG